MQPFCSHRFVERIRWISRIAEKKHGINSTTQKAVCCRAQHKLSEATTMIRAQKIDLVQFTFEFRQLRIFIPDAANESDQVAGVCVKHQAERNRIDTV